MGVEVAIEGLSKHFGRQEIWQDVSFVLPPGEVSVLLGPSGTGKTVFLKSVIGLLKPERGRVLINGVDMVNSPAKDIYETRKLFGLMFQDGALFGSMTLFDNIAFPLREHTRKKESEIRRIVLDRMEMVGLTGAQDKLPGEISGGMRKRAGLARALVLDPQIILCDEPDSGLDPVRTSYLSQLLIDLNAQLDTTMLIVTHNLDIARTVPDNMGMLFRRRLVTFGPREALLTSEEPVVRQFLGGHMAGPIGMSEEKDQATVEREQLLGAHDYRDVPQTVRPQLQPSPGLPPRSAVQRRRRRVLGMLDQLTPAAQAAIRAAHAAHPEPDAAPPAGPGPAGPASAGQGPTGHGPTGTAPMPPLGNHR
ncbi:ATP-binding cassette domain-containing protein [Streptomyces sp. TRM70308]|uniref:ABC transporter ATP-binding protein n=1 Tax=Streptomyces sp. TRM70308 TaxID=3131932 RepID=UPI003D00494F